MVVDVETTGLSTENDDVIQLAMLPFDYEVESGRTGLDKATFVTIFIHFRQGRLGDRQVEAEELARALTFFSQTSPDAARALMRRWQRDPDYLNALRQIEQAADA